MLSVIREDGLHISSYSIDLEDSGFIMEKYFNLSRYKELVKLQENGEISFLDFEFLSLKASVAQQISYLGRINLKNIYSKGGRIFMSSYLYISIASNLTQEQINEIDEEVAKNRREVYLFVTRLPSNLKKRTQFLFLF